MKIKRILVSVDFSKASMNAAAYATYFAKHLGASVTLVNIVPPPVIVEDSFLAFAMTTHAELVQKSYNRLQKEIRKLQMDYPGNIDGHILEGAIAENIMLFARKHTADLIIAGRKGRGKSNSIFGSVASEIIKNSPIPVLIVPEKARFKFLQSITYASDMQAGLSRRSFDSLFSILDQFKSKLNILHIHNKKANSGGTSQTQMNKIETIFSEVDYNFHSIYGKNIENEIKKFITSYPTDLLVMVSHPHNILQQMLGQTMTKNLSYQISVPLLALKP